MNSITNDYRERVQARRASIRRGGRTWGKSWGILQQIREQEFRQLAQIYACDLGDRPIRSNPEN